MIAVAGYVADAAVNVVGVDVKAAVVVAVDAID